MKLGHKVRRSFPVLAGFAGVALCATLAFATQEPNSAILDPYIFQDCPISTVTFVNNYPASIILEDANTICPVPPPSAVATGGVIFSTVGEVSVTSTVGGRVWVGKTAVAVGVG